MCRQEVKGGEPPPLLCPGKTTSGVLCLVPGTSIQKAQESSRDSPTEDRKDDQGPPATQYEK